MDEVVAQRIAEDAAQALEERVDRRPLEPSPALPLRVAELLDDGRRHPVDAQRAERGHEVVVDLSAVVLDGAGRAIPLLLEPARRHRGEGRQLVGRAEPTLLHLADDGREMVVGFLARREELEVAAAVLVAEVDALLVAAFHDGCHDLLRPGRLGVLA
ncbi:MAG TPA: hypothetical protein VL049_15975 [Candidatus Dormibacteraeota bacterium]|nr:hypothetical protein [Candidatus Dormibacteraeota bacterium]